MTKIEFINKAAERAELTKKDMAAALAAIEDTLLEDVFAKEDEVRLGIGKFYGKTAPARPARMGRNPITGEALQIAAVPEKHGQPAVKWSKKAKE